MSENCDKILECGHACKGFREEPVCLPCLNEECTAKHKQLSPGFTEDDYCGICWSSGVGTEPSIMLEGCKHVFHLGCLKTVIKNKSLSPRLVFSYLYCPVKECKKLMSLPQHPEL